MIRGLPTDSTPTPPFSAFSTMPSMAPLPQRTSCSGCVPGTMQPLRTIFSPADTTRGMRRVAGCSFFSTSKGTPPSRTRYSMQFTISSARGPPRKHEAAIRSSGSKNCTSSSSSVSIKAHRAPAALTIPTVLLSSLKKRTSS